MSVVFWNCWKRKIPASSDILQVLAWLGNFTFIITVMATYGRFWSCPTTETNTVMPTNNDRIIPYKIEM